MRKPLFILALMCVSAGLCAQNKTQCGNPTGQERFPLYAFTELPQFAGPSPAEWQSVRGTQVSWGSTDERYAKHSVPLAKAAVALTLNAWRGEKVSAQAVVWTAEGLDGLSCELTPLSGPGGATLEAETGFLRYVMTDGIPEGVDNGCGERYDHTQFDSSMVADCIDPILKVKELAPMETAPVWVSVRLPRDIPAGKYKGKLVFRSGDKPVGSLDLTVKASERVLPPPHEWSFHLDLWQNPFAVARYYRLPLWSEEHFNAMRPIMERLAAAGQKVITASIIDKPWNGQTEDPFKSMISWIRRADGSWEWRYDVFDKWVEFMMSCGIDAQINCYTMVPWRLSFRYFDQLEDDFKEVVAVPGSEAFEAHWLPFLKDFAAHLKAKGWFSRCCIAMDERPMEDMLHAIGVVRKADPDFKIAMAGGYHPEIEPYLFDYCIGLNDEFPAEVLERRKAEGKVATYYTCCHEPLPNIFTFSPPAEGEFHGVNMAARGVDGYLRWTVIGWPLEPLLDSRFRTWPAGDTYTIYPGNRTSIRFERLMEGVQDYEKIRLLREEYTRPGNMKALSRLEECLAPLGDPKMDPAAMAPSLKKLKSMF